MSDDASDAELIFRDALKIKDPAERGEFIRAACGEDSDLLDQALRLLNGRQSEIPTQCEDDASIDEWFQEHVNLGSEFHDAATMVDDADGSGTAAQDGDQIGRYRLLRQIGEGGFGSVFMAEQSQPVKRRVALKVVKWGMDTKQFVARFEAERQALALMDHPNIAGVLDAGATETGRPYFVMELVRGIQITSYCDEAKMSVGDRLRLFAQVCSAIQHAHQKGVIHRDIKPSNVLVTEVDGAPVPKVIDFGIAKAIDQDLTDKTVFTRLEQFLGTPAYTSPEQAGMGGEDIDTRADIYSLGVLLYELLAGAPPFDNKSLVSRGFDEMRRTIRDVEPARPSTKLGSSEHDRLNTVAERRKTEAPHLVSLLQGDLDWIVMKAIDKDRSRRYETANGLAMDVQRYLSNEPIVARPPSSLYRFEKLAQRHRIAVLAAFAGFVALIVGFAFAVWHAIQSTEAESRQELIAIEAIDERDRAIQAEAEARLQTGRAEAARQRAEAERTRAEEAALKSAQVARILTAMMEGAQPQVALGRDASLLLEIVDATSERLSEDLEGQPLVEAELRETLSHIYFGLGSNRTAVTNALRALELRKTLFSKTDPRIAPAFVAVARTYTRNPPGHLDRFIEEYARVIEQVRKEDARNPLLPELFHQLGRLQGLSGSRERAIESYRQALEASRLLDADPSVWTLNQLGRMLIGRRNTEEGLKIIQQAVALGEKLDVNHPSLLNAYTTMGDVHEAERQIELAAEYYQKALSVGRATMPEGNSGVRRVERRYAGLRKRMPKESAALKRARQSLDAARKKHSETGEFNDLYPALRALADRLYLDQRYSTAIPLLRECRKLLAESDTVGAKPRAMVKHFLADSLLKGSAERTSSRTTLLAESAELFGDVARAFEGDHPYRLAALQQQGEAYARLEQWKKALSVWTKRAETKPGDSHEESKLALLSAWLEDPLEHRMVFERMWSRFPEPDSRFVVDNLLRAGTVAAGEPIEPDRLRQLADQGIKLAGDNGARSPTALLFRGVAALRSGKPDQGLKDAEQALQSRLRASAAKTGAAALRTLAYARLGRFDQARKSGEDTQRRIRGVGFGVEGMALSSSWDKFLYAALLLREAETALAKQEAGGDANPR